MLSLSSELIKLFKCIHHFRIIFHIVHYFIIICIDVRWISKTIFCHHLFTWKLLITKKTKPRIENLKCTIIKFLTEFIVYFCPKPFIICIFKRLTTSFIITYLIEKPLSISIFIFTYWCFYWDTCITCIMPFLFTLFCLLRPWDSNKMSLILNCFKNSNTNAITGPRLKCICFHGFIWCCRLSVLLTILIHCPNKTLTSYCMELTKIKIRLSCKISRNLPNKRVILLCNIISASFWCKVYNYLIWSHSSIKYCIKLLFSLKYRNLQ